MSKKKKCEVVLALDVPRALASFSFIQNENDGVTLIGREDKGAVYSLCDGAGGAEGFCCFWDRHPFKGTIFKCPIRKIYTGEQKTYKSNINGNTYTLRNNLNTDAFYYETDGHFCSPECRASFLDEEEVRNPLYANSRQLIMATLGKEPQRAPHWRTLRAYGGTLAIEEFRASFAYKEYSLEEVASGHYPFIYRFKEAYHL